MGGLRRLLENPLALGSDPDLKPVVLCRAHVLTMAVRNMDVKCGGTSPAQSKPDCGDVTYWAGSSPTVDQDAAVCHADFARAISAI